MTTAIDRVTAALDDRGLTYTFGGGQYKAQCPAHDDRNPSLGVKYEYGRVLICCYAGCDTADVLAALGITQADLFDEPKQRDQVSSSWDVVESYHYSTYGMQGVRVDRVYRDGKKIFPQYSINGRGGDWVLGLKGAKPRLYRWIEVVAELGGSRPGHVDIAEGEKCVHALEAAGRIATTNAMGAGKWKDCYSEIFAGHDVTIYRDKDEKGIRHADQVRASLEKAGAASVRIMEAADGFHDIADHLAAGRPLDEAVQAFPVPGDIGGEQGNTGNADDPPLWVDVGGLLDDGLPDPPEPEFLRRTDQRCLFYAGQVNLLFGDPESAKTLVALAAGSETLNRGRKLAIIDIDHNGPVATVCRLIDMGVDESILRRADRFRYVEPEDKQHLVLVTAALKEWAPDVVVVDSIGELLPLMRLSSNSPDDFTIAHAAVLKPMAMAGSCVVAIDHLPKNLENRQSGPTGTAAKRRAIGGVSLRVTVDTQFTPGQGGKACLSVNKDRHGSVRRNCPVEPGKEPIAGWFKIEAKDDCIAWSIESPQRGDTAPADRVDPRDLKTLNEMDPPPTSVRDVKQRCNWRTDRAMSVLRAWRSRRSQGVPGERGNTDDNVLLFPRSPFPTPVPGNTGTGTETAGQAQDGRSPDAREHCRRCHDTTSRLLGDGQCVGCSYPAGGAPEEDDGGDPRW